MQVRRYPGRIAKVLHPMKVVCTVYRLHRDLLRCLPTGGVPVLLLPLPEGGLSL